MAKTKLKAVPAKLTLADKIKLQQRALEAGKAGYQRSDELLDEITEEMTSKGQSVVDLGDGQTATLVDQLASAPAIPYGGKARRYKIKVSRAADVVGKL